MRELAAWKLGRVNEDIARNRQDQASIAGSLDALHKDESMLVDARTQLTKFLEGRL